MKAPPESEFMRPRPGGWACLHPIFLYCCPDGHVHRFLSEAEDRVCPTSRNYVPCLKPLVLSGRLQ